ncbi:low molecular weight protein-tyrosine-phosphatase [Chitinivibrio alkaliphilus]|uniref:Protein tyrosine phosphatase n=1 Tax=Chitinivibrio alkaliphilus ACht1 TaxID=1313304 RepID=U7D6Q5_9BACT|nr:low molecular weight protein-tyrosine-phosphatase [Chitinivibrio alkaliphilus]ERP32199.1 protein tyrosine phosphatase [Chitinivibrio alkaliphilus ACht1]
MIRVLFVCLGNICRSPSAEAVFRHFVEKNHLEDCIEIDSAGTSAYHVNEPADRRMQSHAEKRGYTLTSRARQFTPADFSRFDYLIAQDRQNYADMAEQASKADRKKLFKMTDFAQSTSAQDVPDPYYGGPAGFERVLDILEDSCEGLLAHITAKENLREMS